MTSGVPSPPMDQSVFLVEVGGDLADRAQTPRRTCTGAASPAGPPASTTGSFSLRLGGGSGGTSIRVADSASPAVGPGRARSPSPRRFRLIRTTATVAQQQQGRTRQQMKGETARVPDELRSQPLPESLRPRLVDHTLHDHHPGGGIARALGHGVALLGLGEDLLEKGRRPPGNPVVGVGPPPPWELWRQRRLLRGIIPAGFRRFPRWGHGSQVTFGPTRPTIAGGSVSYPRGDILADCRRRDCGQGTILHHLYDLSGPAGGGLAAPG